VEGGRRERWVWVEEAESEADGREGGGREGRREGRGQLLAGKGTRVKGDTCT
jgi:hypothetical protein